MSSGDDAFGVIWNTSLGENLEISRFYTEKKKNYLRLYLFLINEAKFASHPHSLSAPCTSCLRG